MEVEQLKPNVIVRGPIFSEPVQVIVIVPMGPGLFKLIGKGMDTGAVHEPILTYEQMAMLEATPECEPCDGDPERFRLGIEALRLGLAYEYDPYFSLSIARIDPLPHQLEAVYEYFLASPRIRFLLADDPGAGKTIMAGLLLKELKIRGLVQRTLIVTPANLTFQWQRELKDKFRENFEVVRSDVLRANYGLNPWQDRNQVITSLSWVSRIEDAKESLLRSHWDLIIVDEAHKMSASADHKTLAYELGEHLSELTGHYLLMTATPHKGDPIAFCRFLELLDRDAYADVSSLEEAMKRSSAPFYLRRTKEALVTFPNPDTGEVKTLFTKRLVQTADFHINEVEMQFYLDLTSYVEGQSIKALQADRNRGRAIGFTMAMLQRRFASSIRAARRSLERMREKREKILDDPEGYRQAQMAKRIPDDFDDLTEEEQQELLDDLEWQVASVDRFALQEEIRQLSGLIDAARSLEQREVESKLTKLRQVLEEQGIFADPQMKLLIFTEHKDTLDYLVQKLRDWGLSVTQIYGGMKIGSRDEPGSRLHAERAFREDCQVLVATEAAGEGINLQFCWCMINYDIPWNPIRLEQRMGRIHRYGQEKDCLIFNFVATNTREGRVLAKLFERLKKIEDDLDPKRTGSIFNVLGDVLPANELEGMLRDMYTRNLTVQSITDRIVEKVDTERFRRITHSTLEGLAKRELNLSAIVGKSAEAKKRRLVPEVVEQFFVEAAELNGIYPKETKPGQHVYRIGKVHRSLWPVGELNEPRFGRLAKDYKEIAFDKELLNRDITVEWVTPGHPLFEAVRTGALERVAPDLERGAAFFDLDREEPARLDVFSAAVRDGRGNVLHRRLFVVQTEMDSTMTVLQPTVFLDLIPAPDATVPEAGHLPPRGAAEALLVQEALQPFLDEVAQQREHQIATVAAHVERSLQALIDRQNQRLVQLLQRQAAGDEDRLLPANLQAAENALDELSGRLERRRIELQQEQHCTIADIRHQGRAWVLPHPDRYNSGIAPMVSDPEIERIAVDEVIRYEESQGRVVKSVEKDNEGFDLISSRPYPDDPVQALDVRFIEVKGRAKVGEVALSRHEYRTAQRLKDDYWLYVVYNCATEPHLYRHQNPAQMGWEAVTTVEHYRVRPEEILESGETGE